MCVPNLRKHYDNADLYVFIIFLLDEYYNLKLFILFL